MNMLPSLIDVGSAPAPGTVFIFPPGARAGRRKIPARLIFLGLYEDDNLWLEETDGAPWPDAETHLSVAYWNETIAPLVQEVFTTEDKSAVHSNELAVASNPKSPRADLVMVRIADIDASRNLRADTDEKFLLQLSDSIKDLGLLQPVIVRTAGKVFRMIAGHQRLEAARRAGEEFIEAKVYGGAAIDDRWEARARLAENVQRRDLGHMDLAKIFGAAQRAGMTVRQIAEEAHVSDDAVYRHLALLRLCEPVVRLVASGRLPVHQAELIARVGDLDEQIELAEMCLALQWDRIAKTWTPAPQMVNHNAPRDSGAYRDYIKPMEDLRVDVARTMRGMAACGWPMKEPYAGKRACQDCPDNTQTYKDQPMLFAGIHPQGSDKKGFCTNEACYEAKSRAHEKVLQQRRKEQNKKTAIAVARAKKAGLAVCEGQGCGKVADAGQKFPPCKEAGDLKLCDPCAAKAKKRATGGGGIGESYDQRQKRVAALAKKFPWEKAQKFALALWTYARDLAAAIGKQIELGKANGPVDVIELLLTLELRPMDAMGRGYCWPGTWKGLPGPREIVSGKHFTGKDLGRIWKMAGYPEEQCKPHINSFHGEVRHVPLGKELLAAITFLEVLAKALLGKTKLPPRPKEADFCTKAPSPAIATGNKGAILAAIARITTGNKEAALKVIEACQDLAGLRELVDPARKAFVPVLKGDWRRAAVHKRIKELEKDHA
jgi:ParB/RepB/Spo0J family partition protein